MLQHRLTSGSKDVDFVLPYTVSISYRGSIYFVQHKKHNTSRTCILAAALEKGPDRQHRSSYLRKHSTFCFSYSLFGILENC